METCFHRNCLIIVRDTCGHLNPAVVDNRAVCSVIHILESEGAEFFSFLAHLIVRCCNCSTSDCLLA